MNFALSFLSLCSTLVLAALLAWCPRGFGAVVAIQSRTFDEDSD